MTVVPITSPDLDASEVSWFAALCSDDYQFLGVPDGALRSSWEHCSGIVKRAEGNGFRNILTRSSFDASENLCPDVRRLFTSHAQAHSQGGRKLF